LDDSNITLHVYTDICGGVETFKAVISLTVPTLFLCLILNSGDEGREKYINMKQTYVEFKDFEYVEYGVLPSEEVKINIYVKVLDINDEYLGSLNWGIYKDLDDEALKECISDIVNQNFPSYKSYNKIIFKRI